MKRKTVSRRILVCVTGLTPQVVTETIYALAQQQQPWVPDEVHVLTTRSGAERASLLLGENNDGQLEKLCQDYGLTGVHFDKRNIHVLTDDEGRPLDDIRSQSDNLAVADSILAFVAEITSDPNNTLHMSLAGGRKSMGFFAGYALSLYGRPQDRLSHVLVSEGFETLPDFFYPPRKPVILETRAGKKISTADAKVDLADIPFVRLRDRLPRSLLGGGRFVDAVQAAQKLEKPPELVVNVKERTIVCADTRIELSAANFAVYSWLAQRALKLPAPGVQLSAFNAIDSPLREELRQFGQQIYPNEMSVEFEQWSDRPWNDNTLNHGQWLSERRSRINSAISTALGRSGKKIYGIASIPLKGRETRHQIMLQPESIKII